MYGWSLVDIKATIAWQPPMIQRGGTHIQVTVTLLDFMILYNRKSGVDLGFAEGRG